MTLFDPGPTIETPPPAEKLSADARRTKRNNDLLALGIHPATRLALRGESTCGECEHAHRYSWHNNAYWKCDQHRLGESHSAASDVRISWPACTKFEVRP